MTSQAQVLSQLSVLTLRTLLNDVTGHGVWAASDDLPEHVAQLITDLTDALEAGEARVGKLCASLGHR